MDKKNFDGYELIPVAKLDLGGGYDWDEFEVYYVKSERRFFWLSGQGCSCDFLWLGYMKLGDLENGDREAVARAIRRYGKERSVYNRYAEQEAAEVIAQVMGFRH